ncbi:Acidic mammalian chitinase [Blattella germanica]|nr:Acidic mammalian chitinase [Blattella germanica]
MVSVNVFGTIFVFFAILQCLHFATISKDDLQIDPVVFCYYGSWATYRTDIGKFAVEDIDTSLCTHIVYAFMGLKNGVIASLDEYNDFEENWGKGSLKKFQELAKNNGIKAIVAIGGWNEGSKNYSKMAATEESRNEFADSVVAFVQRFNFDGFDLDWEYPTKRGGVPEDKENYSLLLQTLSEKLHDKGLTLSVAVAADPTIATEGYDIPKVGEFADYVSVMTFDYHTPSSDNVTGLNSPLHQLPNETERDAMLNVENSINHWLDGGVPTNKLLVGTPLYGRTYTLENSEYNDIGAPIVANGTAGPYTRQPGSLAYYEICMNDNWQIVKNESEHFVYGYHDNQWVSFEDISTIVAKAELVNLKGLAGMMFWSLESDDFRDVCGGGTNPLLNAANIVMGRLWYLK